MPRQSQMLLVGRMDFYGTRTVRQYVNGEFAMAVVQAKNLLKGQCQIESGPLSFLDSGPYGTFIGVYDGHGFASEQNSMSADVLKKAYEAKEDGFFSVITKQWPVKPQIAAVGPCCLVGVICGAMLYVASVLDSRVVLGRHVKAGEVLAVQLSAEHNVSIESVRKELRSMHSEDRQIVLRHNVWHVKGQIQVRPLTLGRHL